MKSIRRLGLLIVRLANAIKACSVDGQPKKEPRLGKPPSDFICKETIAELEQLTDTRPETFGAAVVVHTLQSQDWDLVPDFDATRTALDAFKWAAKVEQRKLIDEAYAAAKMVNDHPEARNEELTPRLIVRYGALVGVDGNPGWITNLAMRCTKLSKKLGLDGEFLVGDLSTRSFVELCGTFEMLMSEMKQLQAVEVEQQNQKIRLAAIEREQKAATERLAVQRLIQSRKPQAKTSGF